MSFTDKLITIAENQQRVFDAGFAAGVSQGGGYVDIDPIPATVTGVQVVAVNDVSEIPHNISVQLSSDTIMDFSGVTVWRTGKNLLNEAEFLDATSPRWITGDAMESIGGSPNHGYFPLRLADNTTYSFSWESVNPDDVPPHFTLIYFERGTEVVYDGGKTKCYFTGTGTTRLTYTFTTSENTDYYFFVSGITSSAANLSKIKWAQIECGGNVTGYEPSTVEEYRANTNGTVNGVTSTLFNMTVFADADISLTVGYNKSKGVQAEYDRFWDAYQDNGNRKIYSYAFYYTNWNDTNFSPKYDIVLVGAASDMFGSCYITNLKDILEKQNVVLDTSQGTMLLRMFNGAQRLTHVPRIDASAATDIRNMFMNCSSLTKIDSLVMSETTGSGYPTGNAGVFQNCTKLTDLTIEGTFAITTSLKWSPLTRTSIESVISALSDTTTGQTLTLKSTAVASAFETSEGAADGSASEAWTALVASKSNWTIALA